MFCSENADVYLSKEQLFFYIAILVDSVTEEY